MKIAEVRTLPLDGIKVVKFVRFRDHRGYFTEPYRRSDLRDVIGQTGIVQCNESFSRRGTIRGLHFQWHPYMGKLVRTLSGHMLDIVLDIRKGSPTLGKALMYDMPSDSAAEGQEWIWVPPGFAHGNLFLTDTSIEYLCTGEYSQGCEAGISPLSPDLDWSLCQPELKQAFDEIAHTTELMTDKDRNGFSMGAWLADSRSEHFSYDALR